VRFIRRGGVEQLKNTMRACFKKNQRLDIGSEIPRAEAGKPRQSGVETRFMTRGGSGCQLHGKNCLAWGVFTPCTRTGSLLEAVEVLKKNAVPGDVILLSPACSNFIWFRIYQNSGSFSGRAVSGFETATGSGVAGEDPNRQENETD
jgi:hypothetical protein